MSSMEEVLEQNGGPMLSTYLAVLTTPHLMGKTHVGDLRHRGSDGMGARVISMTSEVMAAAQTIIADLQSLQDDFVEMHTKQRGELPAEAKTSWGKMHVFTALLQQLKTEVDSEMAEVASTAKGFSTVDDKRKAWEKRLDPEWKQALYANSASDKTREAHHRAVFKKSSAAASAIQSAWRERQRRKRILKESQDALKSRLASDDHAEASETIETNAKLKMREHNELRKDMHMSVRQFQTVDTAYQVDGSLHRADSDVFRRDGSQRHVQGTAGLGRISRKVLPVELESSSSEEEEERKPTRVARRKVKKALNAGRLAALAAPKKAVDLEALQQRLNNNPVWRGSGAFQGPSTQMSDIPAWLRNQRRPTPTNIPAPEPSPKYVPRRWSFLRETVGNETEMKRLLRLKEPAFETAKKIEAPNAMRVRMHQALENFQAFGRSLDNWVKENRHVLTMMVEDCKDPTRSVTTDSSTGNHKELVAHQLMVMSSMWGVMQQNVMAAQEAILGHNPASRQQGEKFTWEEMKDGSATIMKMWREISDTANPLQVALGNVDPKTMIALMMKKAEKDTRDTKDKERAGTDAVSQKMKALDSEGAMGGLLSMFASNQTSTLELEKDERMVEPVDKPRVRARYMQPKKLYINDSPVRQTRGSSLLSPAGTPLGPREAQQKSFRLGQASRARSEQPEAAAPAPPPAPAAVPDTRSHGQTSAQQPPLDAGPAPTTSPETNSTPARPGSVHPEASGATSVSLDSGAGPEPKQDHRQPQPPSAKQTFTDPERPNSQPSGPPPLPMGKGPDLQPVQSVSLQTKPNYRSAKSTKSNPLRPGDGPRSPAAAALPAEKSGASLEDAELDMSPEVRPIFGPTGPGPQGLALSRVVAEDRSAGHPLAAPELLALRHIGGSLPQPGPTQTALPGMALGVPQVGSPSPPALGQTDVPILGQGQRDHGRQATQSSHSSSLSARADASSITRHRYPVPQGRAARSYLAADARTQWPAPAVQGQSRSPAPLPALSAERDNRIISLLAECDGAVTAERPEDMEKRKVEQILTAVRADRGQAADGGRLGLVKKQPKDKPGVHHHRRDVQSHGHGDVHGRRRANDVAMGSSTAQEIEHVVPHQRRSQLAPVLRGNAKAGRQGFQAQQQRLPYQAQSTQHIDRFGHHEAQLGQEDIGPVVTVTRPQSVVATPAWARNKTAEPASRAPPEAHRPHSIPGSLGALKGHKTRAPIGGTAPVRMHLPSLHAWGADRRAAAAGSGRATVPGHGHGPGSAAGLVPWTSNGYAGRLGNHSPGGMHALRGSTALSAA